MRKKVLHEDDLVNILPLIMIIVLDPVLCMVVVGLFV